MQTRRRRQLQCEGERGRWQRGGNVAISKETRRIDTFSSDRSGYTASIPLENMQQFFSAFVLQSRAVRGSDNFISGIRSPPVIDLISGSRKCVGGNFFFLRLCRDVKMSRVINHRRWRFSRGFADWRSNAARTRAQKWLSESIHHWQWSSARETVDQMTLTTLTDCVVRSWRMSLAVNWIKTPLLPDICITPRSCSSTFFSPLIAMMKL